MFRRSFAILVLLVLFESCLTYYQRNLIFHEQFAIGNYSKANELLDKNTYIQKARNKLLYLFDKGVTLMMMGDYEESNKILEEAYIFIDDFQRNLGREALSLVTNEMMRDYGGEDFERVFIHYYKALNYIMLDQLDEALVEVRRINIKLNEITDKYKSENKYKRDAFANVLMGLIYEAAGDENNAFIAYRNAYEIYEEDYSEFFGFGAPEQLKKDLIRTAAKNGFYDSQGFYEAKFKITYNEIEKPEREMVIFWHNGLGPVKDEWSINFVLVRGRGGLVMFENKELGLSFNFYTRSQDEYNSLADLKVIRVAFPKYTVRKQVYTRAFIYSEGREYPFQLLEDVDEIAIKSLRDRMLRELSKTLLRVALKQAAEQAARKNNEGMGAAVSVLNAVTEKADTRNWQTLPAKIYYARLPVKDSTEVNLVAFKGDAKLIEAQPILRKGKKIGFGLYHSVSRESLYTNRPY